MDRPGRLGPTSSRDRDTLSTLPVEGRKSKERGPSTWRLEPLLPTATPPHPPPVCRRRFLLESTCFELRWNTLPEPINRTRQKGDHAADGTGGRSGSSVVFGGGERFPTAGTGTSLLLHPFSPLQLSFFRHSPPFPGSRRSCKVRRADEHQGLRAAPANPESQLLPRISGDHLSKYLAEGRESLSLGPVFSDLHPTPPASSGTSHGPGLASSICPSRLAPSLEQTSFTQVKILLLILLPLHITKLPKLSPQKPSPHLEPYVYTYTY